MLHFAGVGTVVGFFVIYFRAPIEKRGVGIPLSGSLPTHCSSSTASTSFRSIR